ncbi:hypothetical protein B0H13DRAFT_1906140 [Mycena leptocephala]|nr:hypothetical protein B0H13DRAFT_1906140 [Mycena leptocephala]
MVKTLLSVRVSQNVGQRLEQTDALIQQLTDGRGNIDRGSQWDRINFAEVSTESCITVNNLLRQNGTTVMNPGNSYTVPETPHREKMARRIDVQLARRALRTSERILSAQEMDESIAANIPPLTKFLRAARQTELRFPTSAEGLLKNIALLRENLDDMEEIIMGHVDFEVTEADLDGDKTLF